MLKRLLLPLLLLAALPASADDARLQKIRAIVEGVYVLAEWKDGGVALDPATVNARLVIRDGVLIWVANNFQAQKKVGYSGIGEYRIDESKFSYGYQQLVTSVSDDKGDRIDRSMPAWAHDMALPAMRDFALEMKGDTVLLGNPGALFEMRDDGFVYTDLNTRNVRVWKKVPAQR